MYSVLYDNKPGSYSNPASVTRCSLCNSPKPSTSSVDRSKTWSESTISESSSVGANGAIGLSQQSSRLYSLNIGKTNSVRKTLGARRAFSTSQREMDSSRSESISRLWDGY